MAASLSAAALVLAASACGSGDGTTSGAWSGSVDTLPSGRVVVRNVTTADTFATLEERFRVGSLDEDGPELFGDIRELEIGLGGELYVLDAQASEIRVFDAAGAFQRVISRSGDGPGELDRPAGMALDGAGTLWVMNWGNARYSGFDPASGTVTREVRRSIAYLSLPWPGAFENGTRLVDVGLDRDGEIALLRLDTAFVPSDTIPLPVPDQITVMDGSRRVASITEPFAPQPQWAPRARGGIVVSDGGSYQLHRVAFDGDTTLTIELDRERVPVSSAEQDSAIALVRRLGPTLGGTPDRDPRVHDVRPAHGPIVVDDEDRTWVASVLPPDAPPGWDVFGPDGRFLGSVPMADPLRLTAVLRGGRMAITTEVNGYPEVVVYEVVRRVR